MFPSIPLAHSIARHLRPTVEARNVLAATAQRLAEDGRVQVRKIQGSSTKKGKYAKHSVELEEVCVAPFTSIIMR
jgi:ribosome recycling factor